MVVAFGSREFDVYRVAKAMSTRGYHLAQCQHPARTPGAHPTHSAATRHAPRHPQIQGRGSLTQLHASCN